MKPIITHPQGLARRLDRMFSWIFKSCVSGEDAAHDEHDVSFGEFSLKALREEVEYKPKIDQLRAHGSESAVKITSVIDELYLLAPVPHAPIMEKRPGQFYPAVPEPIDDGTAKIKGESDSVSGSEESKGDNANAAQPQSKYVVNANA